MASKALTDRQKQVDHLIGYIQTHAERTAKILTVRAEKLGAPEALLDLEKVQLSQAWWLRQGYEALRRKEAAYLRRKHEAPELRTRREELTRELYDQVVAVRGFLERVYGKPATTRLTGLEGRTPRDPWELARAGRTLVDRLRTEGGELPEPRFPGVEFEPQVTAAGVESLARELADVLRSLREWDREMDLLLLARNDARKDLDDLVTGTSEMMDGFYTAAGLRHLVPGVRTPGASVKRALREAPESSRRRAVQDLAEFERRNPASHAVRRRDPVDGSENAPIRARPEDLGSRTYGSIPEPKDQDSSSHAVQTRAENVGSGENGSILRFEDQNSRSHAVRRRNRGERGGREAVIPEPEESGVGT